jgi:hypothetical protein
MPGAAVKRNGNPQHCGHSHEFCERIGFHLLHDVGAMNLQSHFANAQVRRGLFVEKAADYQRQYLALVQGCKGVDASRWVA